ncbi:BTAD domain-containing putative transcriptional regulator [Lentzea sp. HUAS12]|uniref:BTAD domain-containing putative transcriptional regulator n=1 Tax=Lentzea sp. HUAS12 TaxID=2951806 RepID=UPI0020A154C0|nr:BTAD domain-containing putative transcriptional regulator [Lentzea sp. HUAS12]USX56695.1 AfsR/SARP family transcriptional regulator [Lentzea sp. HUAS12]
MNVRVAVLGPLEVHVDDAAAQLAGNRLRAALCRLAVAVPHPVGVDELIDAVWDGRPPDAAAHALQSLVTRLRRALGGAGSVLMDSRGYRLPLVRDAVDALAFQDLLAHGRRAAREGDDERALTTFEEALALWRGPALTGVPDAPYVPGLTTELENLRLDVTVGRFAAALSLGRADEVVADLRRMADEYPLREDFAAQLITALAATGRGGDALAGYERIRRDLAGELGADPGPELRDLHLRLLSGEREVRTPVRRRPPRSLGVPLTSFVGREAELAQVRSSVAANRLTTLVGTGGAGKTRLATEAAREWSADGHREAWMVELAPVTSGTGLTRAVLEALGLREARLRPDQPVQDDRERVLDAMSDAAGLLVMDNCEHLLGAVADLVADIVAVALDVRVLATSREPLGLTGEALTPVLPLALPPPGADAVQAVRYSAVRLFLDRASHACPGFVLDDTSVAAVITIVRGLDGLPLAIELATARLRVLPVAEVARRLSDRFRLLTGGDRAGLPRHRTLRAVVDWSWELLTEPERVLAERLAVFPGGVTEEAAVAVCADEALPAEDVGELLMNLTEKSLLRTQHDTPIRYRMLETLCEYGVERLTEQGLVRAARDRHARHFAELVDALEPVLRGRDQLGALAVLRAEEPNIVAARRFLLDSGRLRAALLMTLGTAWLGRITGDTHEEGWLNELIDAHRGADEPYLRHAEAVQLLSTVDEGRDAGGDQVRHRLAGLLSRLRADPVPSPYGSLDAVLAVLPALAGLADEAEAVAGQARSSPDPWIRAVRHVAAANWAENSGDADRVREEVELALRDFHATGDRWGIAVATRTRAQLRMVDGDLHGALVDLEDARVAAEELGAADDARFLRLRIAWLLWSLGRTEQARHELTELRSVGENPWRGVEADLVVDSMLAGIESTTGNQDTALRLADDVRARLGAQDAAKPVRGHVVTTVLGAIAVVHAVAAEQSPDRLDDALDSLAQAYPTALRTGDSPVIALLGPGLAQVAAVLGRFDDAAEILGAAAHLRGGEGGADVFAVRLTERLRTEFGDRFSRCYRAGHVRDRPGAIARMDPLLLAPPVHGPSGSD